MRGGFQGNEENGYAEVISVCSEWLGMREARLLSLKGGGSRAFWLLSPPSEAAKQREVMKRVTFGEPDFSSPPCSDSFTSFQF